MGAARRRWPGWLLVLFGLERFVGRDQAVAVAVELSEQRSITFLAAENAAGEVLWGLADHDGTVRDVVGHDGQQTVEVDAASVGPAG